MEQPQQQNIVSTGLFRCRLALAEAKASAGSPEPALLLYPRRILDFADLPSRVLVESAQDAAMGYLGTDQVGILVPETKPGRAEALAELIQAAMPSSVNGSFRPSMYRFFVYPESRLAGTSLRQGFGGQAADPTKRSAETRVGWDEPGVTPDGSDKFDQDVDPFALLEDDPHAGLPPWKRALDIVGAGLALILLSPLMALLALAIKGVSPGPALYRQERIGFRGRRFTVLKFRSMHVDNDAGEHQTYLKTLIHSSGKAMHKLDHGLDPRLIPLGKLLRATAMDELPQLFNVLRGDMSLVGPRPCIPYEFDEYEPWMKLRCDATPGMTGLWQVSGKNDLSFNQMVNLDIRYCRTKSLFLDLKILVLTPKVILTQVHDLITRTGAVHHDRQPKTESRSGWVRVLGPKLNP